MEQNHPTAPEFDDPISNITEYSERLEQDRRNRDEFRRQRRVESVIGATAAFFDLIKAIGNAHQSIDTTQVKLGAHIEIWAHREDFVLLPCVAKLAAEHFHFRPWSLHKIVPQVARVKFPVEKLSNIVACGDVEMYEAFGGDIPCEWTWSIRSSRRLKDEYARLALAKLEAAGMKPLIAIRFTEGSEGFSGKLFMEFAIQCPST